MPETTTLVDAPPLRRDARENTEKLRAAALDVFQERGLGAPLEEIAQRAGVSPGTLYNRFGGRDGLIDAVIEELTLSHVRVVRERAHAAPTPWDRFASYIEGICEAQATCPPMTEILAGKYSTVPRVMTVSHASLADAEDIIAGAHAAGVLQDDFTVTDLTLILRSNASIITSCPDGVVDGWRRHLDIVLRGVRRTPSPLLTTTAETYPAPGSP